MLDKLNHIIRAAAIANRKKDADPYLTSIIETLRKMVKSSSTGEVLDINYRKKVTGALVRLATENYPFSESELVSRILEIAEQYVNYSEFSK